MPPLKAVLLEVPQIVGLHPTSWHAKETTNNVPQNVGVANLGTNSSTKNAEKHPVEDNANGSASSKRAHTRDNASLPPPTLGSFMEVSRREQCVRDNIWCLIKLNRQVPRGLMTEQIKASFFNLPPQVSYPALMVNEMSSEEEKSRLRSRNIEQSFTHTTHLFK